jgi:predicted nucleotidyltransferase component of viral defense system
MQYVEQFHLLFLDQLGRKLDKRYFALKGGCNLRFFLKSIRYSEDMDLDVQKVPKSRLQEKVRAILGSKPFSQILQVRGIQVIHLAEPKQTDTTQRWKLILRTTASSAPLHTKIEFSRRGMQDEALFEAIDPELIHYYRLSPSMASHYPAEVAYRQKVGALADRTLTQARDVFDLYLLINSGVNKDLPDELKKCCLKAQENAMSITFATFKSQVLGYLPVEYRAQYDSHSVWETIQLTVVEAIGRGGS